MSLVTAQFSTDEVVPSTYFWHTSDKMQSNKVNSKRPMFVVHVTDGIAFCCPTSGSSDAWNEQNEVHCLPVELNPAMFGGKDSYLAVNQVLDNGFIEIPVEEVMAQKRAVLPTEFVDMTIQLLKQWQKEKSVTTRRWNAPLSKSRKKVTVKRVEWTMYSIMEKHFPTQG